MNRAFLRIGWLSFCCLLVQISFAQTLPPNVRASLDAYFSEYNETSPAASITVSKAGQIVFQKHAGMADLEHGVRADENTVYEAGSVSKQFTAASLLLLVLEGKVSLDDEVQKYIPELPHYERPITLRHLVNHTSGLKDWGTLAGLGGWARGTRVYTNDIALKYIVQQPDLNHAPGDEYIYSNSNYTLMTLIVERVSGQSLAAFTAEKFFEPLGMTKTSWRTNYRAIVPNRAVGYSLSTRTLVMNMPFENTYGHAALLTTTADLDKWNTSWYSFASDPVLRELREQQGVLTNGDTISYAGGVIIGEQNGKRVVYHSGATAGYRAWLSYFPEEELSIAILSSDAGFLTTNTGTGVAAAFVGFITEADASPAPDKSEFTADPKHLATLTGDYASPATEGRWSIRLDGSQLKLRIHPHEREITLRPLDENRFAGSGIGEITFNHDLSMQVRGLSVTLARARNVWFEKSMP